MASNKYPYVKNLYGAENPLLFPGLVQAGSTQEIKKGEICTYNETASNFIPLDAVTDCYYSLAIAAEEQKSDDSARYINFFALRPGDVFEFEIDASAQVAIGEMLEPTASNSQKLTRDLDGNGICSVVGFDNYPQTGTDLTYKTYAQVVFNPEFSYWEKIGMRKNLKKVINLTSAYTLKPEDCGAILTNKGASGAVTITGPGVTTSPGIPIGWNFIMACSTAQALIFDPKPDTAGCIIAGGNQADGKYISIGDEGDFAHFVWDGTDWLAYASISGADGDITVESS